MTLGAIASFHGENNLHFIGFDLDPHLLGTYRRRFPDDRAATHLDEWQIVENENPYTFAGMYQFWIQKKG